MVLRVPSLSLTTNSLTTELIKYIPSVEVCLARRLKWKKQE
jgi:hypothetical protein